MTDRRKVEWREGAACREVEDPEVFFPDRSDEAAQALASCEGCLVLASCRAFALQAPERYGVWGGLTEEQREILVRLQRATLTAGVGRRSSWGLRRRPGIGA